MFKVSNNEAEYEALLHGLRLSISLGIKRLLVFRDFKLVVQQVNKEWDTTNERMDDYITEICKLENKFAGLEIQHVIHDNNVGADVLSKLGSTRAQVPPCLCPKIASSVHQGTNSRHPRFVPRQTEAGRL